jgi:hypothetical protein
MREIRPAPNPIFLVTRKTLHGSKVLMLEEERTVRCIIDRNFFKNEQCIESKIKKYLLSSVKFMQDDCFLSNQRDEDVGCEDANALRFFGV